MKNFRGFTLIELMIVVGIISILTLIAVPTTTRLLPKYQLGRAARDMVSTLRRARSLALMNHRDVTVRFSMADSNYTVNGTLALPLGCTRLNTCYGAGVEFGIPGSSSDAITFTDDAITFNSMGFPKSGNTNKFVYLRNSKDSGYRIEVRGLAGTIRLDQCGAPGVTCN